MRISYLRTCIFILVLFISVDCQSQATDSLALYPIETQSYPSGDHVEDEEMNIFLAGLGLVGMGIIVGVAMLTVVLAALVMLIISVLTGVGILSASVAVGLYRNSFQAGIITSVYCISALITAVGGGALSWVICEIFFPTISAGTAVMTGAVAGAIGGILGGMSIIWVVRTIYQLTVSKLCPALKHRTDQHFNTAQRKQ